MDDDTAFSEEEGRALCAVFTGEFNLGYEELKILYNASYSPHFGEALRGILAQSVGPYTVRSWREAQ